MAGKQYDSILDIIGPEMIGPSSSHTAGAARIGSIARSILNRNLQKVRITLYNSFAETGLGHGTHKAVLAGLLGFSESDERIRNAESIAAAQGINVIIRRAFSQNDFEPNTAVIEMFSEGLKISVTGVSTGGGAVVIRRIDGFDVSVTGDYDTLIITHRDRMGVLAGILNVIAEEKLNVVSIDSSRKNRLDDVKTVIAFEGSIRQGLESRLLGIESVCRVRFIHKIQKSW